MTGSTHNHSRSLDIKHLNRWGWLLVVVTVVVALGGGTVFLACVGQLWPKLALLGKALIVLPIIMGWLMFVIGRRVLAMTGRSIVRGEETIRVNPYEQTRNAVERTLFNDAEFDRQERRP